MHSDRARFFAEDGWTGGVIGLGYVGLPLAVTMVENGLRAIGYDRSEERVAELNRGISPVEDVSDEQLAAALANGLLITSDASRTSRTSSPLLRPSPAWYAPACWFRWSRQRIRVPPKTSSSPR